jgi:hypothetical protein
VPIPLHVPGNHHHIFINPEQSFLKDPSIESLGDFLSQMTWKSVGFQKNLSSFLEVSTTFLFYNFD